MWLLEENGLVAGDYLILDNARIHHGGDAMPYINQLLELAGVRLIYLPAYSPELNPCELVFGHVKRAMNIDRRSDLLMWEEVLMRFADVTTELMHQFYKHCIMLVN